MTRNYTYPDAASFLLTEDCNFRCNYCFEKCRKPLKMPFVVIERGLEMLCEGAKRNGKKSFHAMIFGGEPMLCPDQLEHLLDYGWKLGKKHKIRFSAGIITNASILTERHIMIMMEYRDKVSLNCQLSIDGIEEVQNMYRRTATGEDSFHLVERNIPKFKQIYKNNPLMLNIHGCLNRFSLPYLFESYKFFLEEWGIENIWFMPVHEEEWTFDDSEIYRQELEKIANYVMEKVKSSQSNSEAMRWVEGYSPINRCLRSWKAPNKPCGAGVGFITITANGDIYPCHHLYFNDPERETKIGDIWVGIDPVKADIYQKYEMSDLTCESDCDHPHCYRCIAVNYVANGSIISQLKGGYCLLSRHEADVQKRIREELSEMGLLKNKNIPNTQPTMKRDENEKFLEAWSKDGVRYEKYQLPNGEYSIRDRKLASGNNNDCNCGCGKDTDEAVNVLTEGVKVLIQEVAALKEKVK